MPSSYAPLVCGERESRRGREPFSTLERGEGNPRVHLGFAFPRSPHSLSISSLTHLGRPEDSGISLEAVKALGTTIPLFGVCMGHQCIGQAFGGDVIRAPGGVMHGKASPVHHTGVGLLAGLPSPFMAARYHSLVIDRATLPPDLEVTAWTEDGTIMAVRHVALPHIQGVQFHPESIITDGGKQLVANFVAGL